MKLNRVVVLSALVTILTCGVQRGIASEADGAPIVGGEITVATPLEGTRKTMDTGGGVSVYAGYHFQLHDIVGLSLLGQPEFSFFPSDKPRNPSSGNVSSPGSVSIMALNAGPRLTIGSREMHAFIDGRGGYYRELSGPLNDDGPGYNVGAGAALEIARNTSLTIGGRYNESFMRAQRGSHENLRFVTAAMGISHTFRAPEAPAPAPAPAPPPPPPPAPPMKKKMILRGVNFDFDKSDIRPDARPVLDQAIRSLQESGDVRVSVEGHTDSRGTEAYNQALSVRRANSVAAYLERGGIEHDRLEVRGLGESQPIASNDTEDGRAQNRRVELNVVP